MDKYPDREPNLTKLKKTISLSNLLTYGPILMTYLITQYVNMTYLIIYINNKPIINLNFLNCNKIC